MTSNKFYDKRKLEKIKGQTLTFTTTENMEKKNVILQQRIYDLKWTIMTSIELLNKGNNEKALKLLKKVLYEK